MSQQEWKILVESGFRGTDVDTDWLRYLARVPELLHRCRDTLHGSSPLWETDIPGLVSETNSLLEDCRINIVALRERLRSLEKGFSPSAMTNLLQVHRIRTLSLALMTGILLSRIHNSLLGEPSRFSPDCVQWSHGIFDLAQVAVKFRPLGSMAMIFALEVAWMGTPTHNVRERIRCLLVDYEVACLGHPSDANTIAGLEATERRFSLQEP